ncbi:AbiH family protein [Psychrobacter alimentarius]|uniref:AbiH family protein n=1 Tax=Psychrobacter alimentarius TaxID=261164 RepID=UPI0019185980|nr:AbiH family protein [Psychrobacter alimentarius]
MSGTRKILILGNGFDLAHFLPTKYDHFMHAMRSVETYSQDKPMTFNDLYTDLISNENYFFENTIKLYKTEKVTLSLNEVKKLQEKLRSNGWFQYFKSYIDSGIETWIDFENEMETVLDAVCHMITEIEGNIEYFISTLDKSKSFLSTDLFNIQLIRKYPFLHDILCKFSIADENDIADGKGLTINPSFIKYYQHNPLNIDESKIFKSLELQLTQFIDIFSDYIEFIDRLELNLKLKVPKVLEDKLETIYSFNYSSTIDRLYKHKNIRFLHGKAGEQESNKIVLGISELENKLLKDEKTYGFVKYYQKMVNNTDYQFLKPKSLIAEIEDRKVKNEGFEFWHPIEIYIWGHSLDSSDSDYVHEIFSFNNGVENSIRVIVYYYDKPHAQMANLISILGKDIVESWMKNEWLEFIRMPDIYKLNFDKLYLDSSTSEFSRSVSKPIIEYKPIIMSF